MSTTQQTYQVTNHIQQTLQKQLQRKLCILKKKMAKEKALTMREEINIPNKHSAHFNPIPKYNLKITFSIYFTLKKSHFSWWLQNHQCSIMTASKLCQNLITKVKPKLAHFSLVCWYWWFSYSLVFKKKKSFKFIHLANEPLKPKFKLYNYW